MVHRRWQKRATTFRPPIQDRWAGSHRAVYSSPLARSSAPGSLGLRSGVSMWGRRRPVRLEVRVPAPSASLGPGSAALGLALDLRPRATLEVPAAQPGVRVIGRDAAVLSRTRNLVEDGILHYLMLVD